MLECRPMRIQRVLTFLFTSISTGLAAAFLVMMFWPELLRDPLQQASIPNGLANAQVVSYADAVQAAAPAVVNIYATKVTKVQGQPLFKDPLFQQLFGNRYTKPSLKKENSLGSGVVVDGNGYILTNHHVIEGASDILIVSDSSEDPVPARIVGTDPDTDLAVIQAGGKQLPVAKLGQSEQLRVGDVVLAIGNPFGVGKTVTQGIVGATGRHELGLANYEDFIQTDAAINQGNSGGALINARGEVVGINTAILSQSGGSHGIGFAIPINLASQVMKQIIAKGKVVRGWIGLSGQPMTQALAQALGMETNQGIIVTAVLENGPGDQAGIRPGDVILDIDGQSIEAMQQMLSKIAITPPGSLLDFTVVREGKVFSVKLTVAERPQEVQ